MNYYVPKQLLTTNNEKTIKGEKYGYTTYVLYMSPFTANSLGKNVCSHASAGCVKSCLFTAGKGSFPNVKNGRTNKTNYFLKDRQSFLMHLFTEITFIQARHKKKGEKFAIRLNGTSDLAYEKLKISSLGKTLFELFPDVQFYDYTKNYNRFKNALPSNYHLTFSRSESNERKVLDILKAGFNAAVVFKTLPDTWNGYKVIIGDDTDLRFLDEKNVVVGLTAKGSGKKDKSGFVVQV